MNNNPKFTAVYEAFENLKQASANNYITKDSITTLLKTLYSFNITIEDWNTIVSHINSNSEILNIVSQEVILKIVECLEYIQNSNVAKDVLFDSSSHSGDDVFKDVTNVQDAIDSIYNFLKNDKLSKTNQKGIVYGTNNATGAQENITYALGNSGNTIAKRDGNGNIGVAMTPTQQYHAASKFYVDSLGTGIRVDMNSALINLHEKLEGKKTTFTLSTTMTISTIKTWIKGGTLLKVVDANGNDITKEIENGAYDNFTYCNSLFDTNNNQVGDYDFTFKYIICVKATSKDAPTSTSPYTDTWVIDKVLNIFDIGDVVLIAQTEVPDRWYAGGTIGFYALETRKIDTTAKAISFDNSNIVKDFTFEWNNSTYVYNEDIDDEQKSRFVKWYGQAQYPMIYLDITKEALLSHNKDFTYNGTIHMKLSDSYYTAIGGGSFTIKRPRWGKNVQDIIEQLANEHLTQGHLDDLFSQKMNILNPETSYTFLPTAYDASDENHTYIIDCASGYGPYLMGIAHIVKQQTSSSQYTIAVKFFGMEAHMNGTKSPLYNIETHTKKTNYGIWESVKGKDIISAIGSALTPENIVGANTVEILDLNKQYFFIQEECKTFIVDCEYGLGCRYVGILHADLYQAYEDNYVLKVSFLGYSSHSEDGKPHSLFSTYAEDTNGNEFFTHGSPISGSRIFQVISTELLHPERSGIVSNMVNGTGTNAIQMKQDGDSGMFTFLTTINGEIVSKNPNATELDETLMDTGGNVQYGATYNFATAIGGKSQASGKRSMAQGTTTIAKGSASHAEGDNCVALGDDSHAEGYATTTYGVASHSEGNGTLAGAEISHAEGFNNVIETTAVGAHAEGAHNVARGQYSHVGGMHNEVNHAAQTIVGVCNDTKEGTLFEVGNGSFTDNGNGTHTVTKRQNAFEVYRDGHAEVQMMGLTNTSVVTKKYVDDKVKEVGGTSSTDADKIFYNDTYSGLGDNVQSAIDNLYTNANKLNLKNGSEGTKSIQGGIDSVAYYNGSFVFGTKLETTRDNQAIFGMYNVVDWSYAKGYPLFSVGNGKDANSRSTAFEVYLDGHAEIQTMGSTNNSVVTKSYVDNLNAGQIRLDPDRQLNYGNVQEVLETLESTTESNKSRITTLETNRVSFSEADALQGEIIIRDNNDSSKIMGCGFNLEEYITPTKVPNTWQNGATLNTDSVVKFIKTHSRIFCEENFNSYNLEVVRFDVDVNSYPTIVLCGQRLAREDENEPLQVYEACYTFHLNKQDGTCTLSCDETIMN